VNYDHRFHAGNFADVHKHIVLIALLERLSEKPTPWFYLDTHAGTGLYELDRLPADPPPEFRRGFEILWQANPSDPLLARYRALVASDNPSGSLIRYPGSPLLARRLARSGDRLAFVEAVPQRQIELKRHLGKRPGVHCRDGYEALLALTPPAEGRGLVFLDPPYESATEAERLEEALPRACARFPQGVFLVWYPWVDADWTSGLKRRLARIPGISFLDWLTPRGSGLWGSGLALVNAPYGIPARLARLEPELTALFQNPLGATQWISTWGSGEARAAPGPALRGRRPG
jgi:23S rRNA (adenine2030-N6)-methyltransferase